MSETYVKDLCGQLEALSTLSAATNACVRTSTGKIQIDDSVTGLLWRKWVNTEDESRTTTVRGIGNLLDTVNDYVASTLHTNKIMRNVTIAAEVPQSGKIVEKPATEIDRDESATTTTTTTGLTYAEVAATGKRKPKHKKKAPEPKASSAASSDEGSRSASSSSIVQKAQAKFFETCDAQTVERLRSLSSALKSGCRGISSLLSHRYSGDYETVALLLDQINYASLISQRIDTVLA